MELFHGLAALFSGSGREFPPTLSTRARVKGRALIKRFYAVSPSYFSWRIFLSSTPLPTLSPIP